MEESVNTNHPYYLYVPRWFIGRLKIIGYSLLVLLFTFLILIFAVKKIIKKNWSTFKCHPAVTPFSNFFGHDPAKSYSECLADNVKSSSEEVMKPYNDIIEIQQSNSNSMLESINGVRGVINSFKENFMNSMQELMNKFGNIGSTIQYLLLKIKALFEKILALYVTLLYFAWSLLKGLESIVRDPDILASQALVDKATNLVAKPPNFTNAFKDVDKQINKGINKSKKKLKKAFCFDADSLVLMETGDLKPMKEINIGDKMFNGITVFGKIVMYQPNTKVYNIDTVNVTADHLCFIDNKWMAVKKLVETKNVNYKYVDYVYSLVTSNNIIPSSKIIFRDYEESNDKQIQAMISHLTLCSLNKNNKNNIHIIDKYYETGELSNCLDSKNFIKMRNNKMKLITEIKIGDEIPNGIVLGVYMCKLNNNEWFQCKGCNIGSSVIVKKSVNDWDKIYNIVNEKHSSIDDMGYHLITSCGSFELKNGIQIRDFMEIDESKTQEKISYLILNHLNSIQGYPHK